MKGERRCDVGGAFILDREQLLALDGIMAKIGGPREYTITLSDKTQLTATAVREVLEYPNAAERPIVGLKVITPWSDLHASVTLSTQSTEWWADRRPGMNYHVRGEEQQLLFHADRLDQWCSGIRAWYSRIALVNPVQVLFFLPLVLGLIVLPLGFYFDLIGFSEDEGADGKMAVLVVTLVVILYGVVLAIGGLLSRFRSALFPIAVFAIGDGKRRFARTQKVRDLVLLAFAISFAASIVATLVFA